jgi:serine/threonine protein kinase
VPPTLVATVLDGRYRLVRQLKAGGMGEIYAAEHVDTHRRVAVKVLRDPCGLDHVSRERFRLEARATSRIVHPHVVEMIDYGVTEAGICYLVMELLYGEDLQATIRRELRLPLRRSAKILVQICKALGAAHALGIVHRDLKPGNCFRIGFKGIEDYIKLIDFGIAKRLHDQHDSGGDPLTVAGTVLGTIFYMPPEQATGGAIDHRVDVYAAGAVFYQLVTGQVPFKGRSPDETFRKILIEEPRLARDIAPELDLPPAFDTLIRKALAKRPEARFASTDELAAAIAALGGLDDARRASASMIAQQLPADPAPRRGWIESITRPFRRRS